MQRLTQTTAGELRIGDRFVKTGKDQTVWQVLSIGTKSAVINQVTEQGHKLLKFDELLKVSTRVKFLRHTIVLPQEECFIQDLKPGDVFCKRDDLVNEYVIEEPGQQFYKVRLTSEATCEYAGKLASVIFIRHKK